VFTPVAIDMHIHPASAESRQGSGEQFQAQAARHFGSDPRPIPIDETADYYRRLQMRAVLLAVDSESGSGRPAVTSEYVARCAREHPDVFIPFGSVDPWKGKRALYELQRAVEELGVKGFKFHPQMQAFFPNEPRFAPLFAAIERYELPVVFHSGTSGIGAGAPGGLGIKLKYARPIPYLDDLAADYPGLKVILAHPSWPWQEEALAMAVHKSNVYIDLSGWSPKYFPESLVRYANSLLQDKVMFGSDYPLITPERWLADFETLSIKPEVRPKILLHNALRLLGLPDQPSTEPA
jgi:uncharacterized protein